MKIYTKIGDDGKTFSGKGPKIPKYHIKVEVEGELDELNSYLGLIIASLQDIENTKTKLEIERIREFLLEIQRNIFEVWAIIIHLSQKDLSSETEKLESEIDRISELLPPLKNFILPGGSKISAITHITRTVCRRAERAVVKLSEEIEIDSKIIPYLNRLSDYLFVLARFFNKLLGEDEEKWSKLARII